MSISRIFSHVSTVTLATACVIGLNTAKAADLALTEAVTMAGMQIFLDSGAPGIVIGVVQGDDIVIQGFGETAPGSGVEPDKHSIFRLASVSKVFAGDVLASLAAKGKLNLTDSLVKYAPDNVSIQSNGRPITLLDLATHSAALPREPQRPDISPSGNPFAAFDRDYCWEWMSKSQPPYAPATSTLYSNLSYGLLGDALAKAGGDTYNTVLINEIAIPAGLKDTTNILNDEQKNV